MKKFFFFAFQISLMVNAQHITDHFQVIRIGTSPELALSGIEKRNFNSGDLSLTFDWVNKFASGNEVGITVAYVDLEPYYFTGGLQANFPVLFRDFSGFETLLGMEVLFLQRGENGLGIVNNEKDNRVQNTWFSLKAKAISRYNISDLIDVSLVLAIQTRQDVQFIWGGENYSVDGFLKIGFKFK